MEYVLLLVQSAIGLGTQWLHQVQAAWPRSLDGFWALATSVPGLAIAGLVVLWLLFTLLTRGRQHAYRAWQPEDEARRLRRPFHDA